MRDLFLQREVIAGSIVIMVDDSIRCSNKVVAWYYLRQGGRLCFRLQEPGAEARIRSEPGVIAIWAWDGSWSKCWELLIEAWALGGNRYQLQKLAENRGCCNNDALAFGKHFNIQLAFDGDAYVAAHVNFKNIHESPVGYGTSYLGAMANLCKELGYVGCIDSTIHFLDLVKQ